MMLEGPATEATWRLRGDSSASEAIPLVLDLPGRRVALGDAEIRNVAGLRRVTLEIVHAGDIIDVCINGRRCLVDRCPGKPGDRTIVSCRNGRLRLLSVRVEQSPSLS